MKFMTKLNLILCVTNLILFAVVPSRPLNLVVGIVCGLAAFLGD